jgi:hypothetical protein
MGIAMTIEDSGGSGSDIVTAAVAHLVHSTPEAFRLNCSDCNSYVTKEIADDAPRRIDGGLSASPPASVYRPSSMSSAIPSRSPV